MEKVFEFFVGIPSKLLHLCMCRSPRAQAQPQSKDSDRFESRALQGAPKTVSPMAPEMMTVEVAELIVTEPIG
jgi:hypothetical protein